MTALYPSDRTGPPRKPPHRHYHQVVNEALSATLSRFDDQLRVGSPTACWSITAMSFASSMPFSDDPHTTDPRQVARLILHGIAAEPTTKDAPC